MNPTEEALIALLQKRVSVLRAALGSIMAARTEQEMRTIAFNALEQTDASVDVPGLKRSIERLRDLAQKLDACDSDTRRAGDSTLATPAASTSSGVAVASFDVTKENHAE